MFPSLTNTGHMYGVNTGHGNPGKSWNLRISLGSWEVIENLESRGILEFR